MQNGTCVTKLQPSNRSGDDTKLVTLSLAGQFSQFVCLLVFTAELSQICNEQHGKSFSGRKANGR